MKTTNNLNIDVEKYKKMVQDYLDLHMYDTALFWADKIMALTNNPRDIYWVGQCMYNLKQYHRAAHLIRSRKLEKTNILCNYLTVRCLLSANDLSEALNVINFIDIDSIANSNNQLRNQEQTIDLTLFDDKSRNQVYSSIYYLKGKVLECSDNRILASDCYKKALLLDVYCFEAFDSLTKYHMLSAQEEEELLNLLPIEEQCSKEESEILKTLYESKLKKYHTPTAPKLNESKILFPQTPQVSELTLAITPKYIETISSTPIISSLNVMEPNILLRDRFKQKNELNNEKTMEIDISDNALHLTNLKNSLDLHVAQAERLYYNCDFQQCFLITTAILKQDPYHNGCLPIHISCQVELGESNKLFSLAHTLVDLYPNLAISWYAVGCYYYIIGKSDYARRYLSKATCLDRLFGPAWMAYGHSFAVENEHDQAMAAYFKASQLMKGCHLPLLYIGLECGLTNNITLAEKFFDQAIAIAPNDPFILHEKGVIAFENARYLQAEDDFKKALKIIKKIHPNLMPQRWVSLLNNLGHVSRKLKKYEEALEYHYQALLLSPQKASIYSSIGYVNALMGNTSEAVDWFHKALGLERDDTFSSSMLTYVIEQLSEELPSFPGAPVDIPKYFPTSGRHQSQVEDSEQSILKDSSNMTMNIHEEIRESASMSMTVIDVINQESNINMSVEMDMTDSSSNN